jgi:hypothetical protein
LTCVLGRPGCNCTLHPAELVGTEVSGSNAIGGRAGSFGGAVRVRGSSNLKLVRSTLTQNSVDGSNGTSYYAYAGAVYIDGDSVVHVSESEIVENVARAALSDSGAGAFYVDGSRLVLALSKINRNVVEGRMYSQFMCAGAIYVYSSAIVITGCELLENVVLGGTYTEAGMDALDPQSPFGRIGARLRRSYRPGAC